MAEIFTSTYQKHLTGELFKRLFPSLLMVITFFVFFAVKISAQDEEKDAVALFNKAQDAHEKGDLIAALKLYEEALEAAPEFPEAEYQRGNIFVSLGKNTEAEKSLLRAIELRADWNLPKISLGQLFLATKRFSEAEKTLGEVLKIEPENFSIYPLLTEAKINLKSSPENLKSFLTQIKNFNAAKPNASLFASQGAIERALDNFVAAQRSLENALALQASDVFALSEIVEVLIALKDFSAAETAAQKLVKLRPNSKIYKLLLAKVFASNAKTAEALQILDALDSQDADVSALRNSIKTVTTDDIAELEKEFSVNPKSLTILSRLCGLTRKTPAKALDYCRKASEAEPNNINHAIGYAAALVQARQFAAAETLLRRLLTIEPDNYTIHANLAAALFELKNYAAAKIEYEWLIRQQPDLAVAYYFLAIASDNLRQYEEAFDNYKMFLKLADSKINQLEIDKVNLRLPVLEKQIKKMK